MNYQYLLVEEINSQLKVIKLNRPSALNALNTDVLKEIQTCFEEQEKTTTRVIILTGEGKAFVAGADISQMKDFNSKEAEEFSKFGQQVFNKIDFSPIITIAAINGFALGGGLELALACDIRIASTNAKLGLPEVSLGLIPGFGGTQRLSRLIGSGLALEVILTGNMFSTGDAFHMGILNRVVEPEKLLSTAQEMANQILSMGVVATKQAKLVAKRGLDYSLSDALNMEAEEFGKLFGGAESKEGMGAFLEKRKPNF